MKKLLISLGILLGVLVFAPDTQAAAWDFQYQGQTAHQTVPLSESRQVKLQIKNTGTNFWTFDGPNAVRLGTSRAQNRGSGFYHPSWLTSNRIRITRNLTTPANIATIQPNEVAEFEFTVTPSLTNDGMGGAYREYFQPVVENITWLPDIGIYWDWTVPAPIGVYFFTWYGGPTGSYGVPPNYRWHSYVDTPRGGTYDSADPTVIRRQLNEIRNAGISFVLLDWWEQEPEGGTAHHHQAVSQVISIINAEYPTLKYALMVEPPLNNAITPIPQGFYNDVWNAWAQHPQYLKYHGKPLMMCYLYRTCIGQDGRYSGLQVSGGPGYAYPTVKLWNYPNPDIQGNVTSIMSRYDDRPTGRGTWYDPTYGEQVWQHNLNFTRDHRAGLRLVFMYGWNEYYERANCEPHSNPDSAVAQTFCTDVLTNWINGSWRS